MANAYLIHGTSTKDDDWFPWLEEAVKPEVKLTRLDLPHPYDPMDFEWNQAVDDQVPAEDGVTLVAHSLGCITALRFIERHDIFDANLVLVGAFTNPLPGYSQLDDFMADGVDLNKVAKRIHKATVFVSSNDQIAPPQDGKDCAKAIGAKLIEVKRAGHFLTSDGYATFPQVKNELFRVMDIK